ncbi:MAG: N-6 DNA methylase [Lachnospiraceae bacterium]|nr:N-6 DNA methylase [Lachnospiraceae bacterium]
MKLKADSTEQKLRGAYYTPLPLAEMMVELFANENGITSVLEPSCGDGVFLHAVIKKKINQMAEEITAIEIDQEEAKKAEKYAKDYKNIKVYNEDFFDHYSRVSDQKKYDLILGNPPYVRYQYLEGKQRELLSNILTSQGMKANKLINTWVGFMVACVNLLSEHGKIAFVIPAEIMQVAYAEDLRLFLADHLSRITLITFEELIFPDIEQEIVVFVGEKDKQEKGIRIVALNNLDDLKSFDIGTNGFQKLQHVHEKWTKYFTNDAENALIKQIKGDKQFQKLSDAALINVGITTGNNKYFSVNQEKVNEYELQDVVRPLIGRSSHANSLYFREDDWMENVSKGKAAYLIDFPERNIEDFPKKQRAYIKLGEKQGENSGYKCRIRDKWYCIPSIWVPDAFFLRRNNLYPKFVLNCCNAVSTDTMHRIKFHEGIEPERIVLSYYNSISFAFTELCGRSYGGGVLEILPGEVGNIMVPKLDGIPIQQIQEILEQVDGIIREGKHIEEALDIVDNNILVAALGYDEKMCQRARGIWKKLQTRRLKRGQD